MTETTKRPPYEITATREDCQGVTYITFESEGSFHTVALLPIDAEPGGLRPRPDNRARH